MCGQPLLGARGSLAFRCVDAREVRAARQPAIPAGFIHRERPGAPPVHLEERAFELVLAPTLAPSSPHITELPEALSIRMLRRRRCFASAMRRLSPDTTRTFGGSLRTAAWSFMRITATESRVRPERGLREGARMTPELLATRTPVRVRLESEGSPADQPVEGARSAARARTVSYSPAVIRTTPASKSAFAVSDSSSCDSRHSSVRRVPLLDLSQQHSARGIVRVRLCLGPGVQSWAAEASSARPMTSRSGTGNALLAAPVLKN